MELFRDSGFEKLSLISGNASPGLVAPRPPANQSVFLLGVHTTGATTLTQGSATGPLIMYVGAGNSNFPSTVQVPNNSGVHSSVGGVSVFYYISDSIV
jgi:hypothetical protein